ncbi:MAG: FecR domain-containing protein [Agarilytica sp.]
MSRVSSQDNLSKLQGQAEYWLVMLDSPNFTTAKEAEFFAWLDASPSHQAAYIQAEETWERGAVISQAKTPSKAQNTPSKGFDWADWLGFGSWAQVGMASLLVVALGFGGYWQISGGVPEIESYQTGVGEQREVRLSDGSVLMLNTSSELTSEISRDERIVRLMRGEVFFDIAKSQGRSFDVYTKAGLVRVLGTQFNVRDSGGETVVTVLEGAVGIDNQESPELDAESFDADVTLRRNQQAVIELVAEAPVVESVDASARLGWRTKSLVFRDDTLQDVVNEVNRYFSTRIELGSEALANKKVAAVIQVSSFETMLRMLEEALDLESRKDSVNDVVYLHSKES